MNTEATQEKSAVPSTGERLRLARESKGLTQQNVAERLCLKVSTVRDIEEDKSPTDLAATFLRGYIRSYARLVNVPEDDILPMLSKQAPVRSAKITPMHNISLGSSSRRKKRDGMLTTFTVLVILVVVGLTVAWWWQNHKASQADMAAMTDSASEVSSGGGNEQSILCRPTTVQRQAQPRCLWIQRTRHLLRLKIPRHLLLRHRQHHRRQLSRSRFLRHRPLYRPVRRPLLRLLRRRILPLRPLRQQLQIPQPQVQMRW